MSSRKQIKVTFPRDGGGAYNALSPALMTAAERLSELASILAVGLIRLRARQSSRLSVHRENSCVDFIAHQSGGVSVVNSMENAE